MSKRPGKRVPLEDQVHVLAEHGIHLVLGHSVDELLEFHDRAEYEKQSYLLLLTVLGDELRGGCYLSDDIWHFDTECIEDHGSYAAIARRMATLANDRSTLQDVRDYVDIERGEVWLEITLDGETTERVEPEIDGDWVDPAVPAWLAQVLEERASEGRFTYFDLGGQDCLIGFATPSEFKGLRDATGLGFEWLSEEQA